MKKNFMHSLIDGYRNLLRHPKYRWWIILGTCAYLLSPIDISPDLVPILGQVDDAAILMLLVTEVYQILSEWVQSRRESVANTTPNSTAENGVADAQTVDVDAVSID